MQPMKEDEVYLAGTPPRDVEDSEGGCHPEAGEAGLLEGASLQGDCQNNGRP